MRNLSLIFGLAVLSLSAGASAQADEFFTCHLSHYYPNFKSEEPGSEAAFDVNLSMARSSDGKMSGTFEVVDQVKGNEEVTLEQKPYKAGVEGQELFDDVIKKLGYEGKVSRIDTYTFGKPTNMGVTALVAMLIGEKGEVVDSLAYAWGASGMGSCNTHQLVPAEIK